MRRDQLAHLLRAAGDLLSADSFVVIGTAALLGSYPESLFAQDRLVLSIEADLIPPDFSEASADVIDGVMGEHSPFQQTHGIYADGVSLSTATLAPGWVERLVPFAPAAANGVVGWCLEPHDLGAAKLVAGRVKDIEFVEAAVVGRVMDPDVLERRCGDRAAAAAAARRLARLDDGALMKPKLDTSGAARDLVRPSPPQIDQTPAVDDSPSSDEP